MRLTAGGIGVVIDGTPILDACDLVAPPGSMLGLVGPNGSGKSTLLRTLYRALRPVAGWVTLDDRDLWSLSARESARTTAVVAQERHDEFEFRVADVVALGRNPHKGTFDRDTDQDRAIILDAMERTGVSRFAGRVFATLSGGEKQRVLVARALAQQSAVLLLDEPTNHLDIRAQLDLLELVRGLGVTTIAALHDLNHASAYCDEVLVMAAGRTVAAGPPDAVLSPALLAEVFGVQAHGSIHAATGRYHLVFTPLPREVAT